MISPESLSRSIRPEGLFWGQEALATWTRALTDSERSGLLHLEVLDWVSSIYWGETLGVQYALLMSEQAPSADEREFWLKVMGEEVDHQQRISSWLAIRGHRPLAPNRLIQEAMKRVSNAARSQSPKALAELILWGQVFFEELGAALIRWRLPQVEDRELRAVLFKIYSDEMAHISAGKRTLEALGVKAPARKDVLLRKSAVVFPIHLIPERLEADRGKIRRAGLPVVQALFTQKLGESERYRPGELVQRWMKVEGYHCIGCHPKRSEGLQLDPRFDPDSKEAYDLISFSRRFEGMNDMVHGGFISMVLDEVMGYAINFTQNRLAFTTELRVEFLKPVKVGRTYRVAGKIREREIQAQAENPNKTNVLENSGGGGGSPCWAA
jgi:hypothetical protein